MNILYFRGGMLDNKYKIIISLVILVLAFTVINYLSNLNLEGKETPIVKEEVFVQKTCEESCKTESCLYNCNSKIINVAIAEKNIIKCNEIKTESIKNLCIEEVNSAK